MTIFIVLFTSQYLMYRHQVPTLLNILHFTIDGLLELDRIIVRNYLPYSAGVYESLYLGMKQLHLPNACIEIVVYT